MRVEAMRIAKAMSDDGFTPPTIGESPYIFYPKLAAYIDHLRKQLHQLKDNPKD